MNATNTEFVQIVGNDIDIEGVWWSEFNTVTTVEVTGTEGIDDMVAKKGKQSGKKAGKGVTHGKDFWSKGATTLGGGAGYKHQCYRTHKPLKLQSGYTVYGGSCSDPVVQDADIYVGLDGSMGDHPSMLPWTKPQGVYYRIPDMQVPTNPETFKKLILWLVKALKDGKKVHVGCIGGHGRTGMVLSALVKELDGEVDAIEYVRKHYCDSAVETSSQVDFLHKHFGIKKASSFKDFLGYGGGYGGTVAGGSLGKSGYKTIAPVESRRSLFANRVPKSNI